MGKPRKARQPCPTCGAIVENLDSRYCSNTCQMKFQHQEYIRRWLAGEIDGSRGEGPPPNTFGDGYLSEPGASASSAAGVGSILSRG